MKTQHPTRAALLGCRPQLRILCFSFYLENVKRAHQWKRFLISNFRLDAAETVRLQEPKSASENLEHYRPWLSSMRSCVLFHHCSARSRRPSWQQSGSCIDVFDHLFTRAYIWKYSCRRKAALPRKVHNKGGFC